MELHGDFFSRHAGPLEVYVLVAVDERGEHVMSDDFCRRRNGKTYIQRKTMEEGPLEGQVSARTCRTCVQNFMAYLL